LRLPPTIGQNEH